MSSRAHGLLLVAFCCLYGTASAGAQTTPVTDKALRDSLVRIVLHWYTAWEPQSISEQEALRRAVAPLITDSRFAMVIDAQYYPTYHMRADTTPQRVRSARLANKEQHHTVTDARMIRFGPDAAVLTLVYRADFVTATGKRVFQNSASTSVFVRTPVGWRIAQYHGSHGPEVVQDSTKTQR